MDGSPSAKRLRVRKVVQLLPLKAFPVFPLVSNVSAEKVFVPALKMLQNTPLHFIQPPLQSSEVRGHPVGTPDHVALPISPKCPERSFVSIPDTAGMQNQMHAIRPVLLPPTRGRLDTKIDGLVKNSLLTNRGRQSAFVHGSRPFLPPSTRGRQSAGGRREQQHEVNSQVSAYAELTKLAPLHGRLARLAARRRIKRLACVQATRRDSYMTGRLASPPSRTAHLVTPLAPKGAVTAASRGHVTTPLAPVATSVAPWGHVSTLPVPIATRALHAGTVTSAHVTTPLASIATSVAPWSHVSTLPVPIATCALHVGTVTSAPPPHPLTLCLERWKACSPNPWVLRTIQKGYRLQFSTKPPMSDNVLFSHAIGQAAVTLREEVCSLLSKGAIREILPHQKRLGFYSRYFLVKKKGGGARPILDLRGLNKHLKSFKFRMLTTAALLRMVRRGDWWTSVDLTDAYFHIPIYPPHRKFLRFGFEGRVYEYTVLPFGMALSPRVFVKCTQAAIAPLRQQGIRLATYIDDWLISADTSQKVERDTTVVISHLTSLGFTINFRKSVLVPSQQTTFIGVSLDSTTLTARLSQDRIDSFLACVRSFHTGQRVTYRQCMQATGLMASAIHLIRLGRFHMRPFQRWVRSLRIPPTGGSRKVWVSPRCVDTLKPWLDAAFLSKGVRIGAVISRKIVTTDASLTGWGAVHAGRSASGVWGPDLQTAHINYLELMAVFLALKHFEALIHGCHVVIRTDNTTTMCYVNKQGGLASPLLDDLARELTLWCDTRLASVRAVHVPGLQNSGADLLSRGRFWYEDWSLHPAVARQIWARFGRPEVDLFASEENAKCSLFFSVKGTPPLGLDALSHSWPDKLLYAFPPLGLIRPTLERIRLHGLTLLLLAPAWGSWRSEIAPLLYDDPWPLPPHRDLLRQAGDEIFHPDPRALDLWVWPVRGRR